MICRDWPNCGDTLRPRMQASPLMDAPRFARNIEAAYRQMWRKWCAGGCAMTLQEQFETGMSLHQAGRLAEAEKIYRQILRQHPDSADALHLLGVLAMQQGQFDAAAELIRQAVQFNPDYAEAHFNLGLALTNLGKSEEAIAACRQSLRLKPALADAHYILGNALRNIGQLDEAIESYQEAIRIKPDYAEVHSNLGNALKDKGQLDQTIASYRMAIQLKPGLSGTQSNLIYIMHYHPACDDEIIQQELRRWNQQYAAPLKTHIQPHPNNRDPSRRLRIGYVSSDFHDHASAFFLLPLLRHHDREQFELYCYAQGAHGDEVAREMKSLVHHWRQIEALTDANVAALIRRDQIDILVDLKLHTAGNRLLIFAQKPAPVQATWLGYPGTTGLDTMDYRLTDPHLDPPGSDSAHGAIASGISPSPGTPGEGWGDGLGTDRSTFAQQKNPSPYPSPRLQGEGTKANDVRCNRHDSAHCSETPIHLPDTFWCYDPLTTEPAISAPPCLETGFVTFGCLNNFCKVNENVLRLWAQVLKNADRSRLILLCPEGSHRQPLLDLLQREGIDPGRIEFIGRLPRRQYLELYHRIDAGLDTFPCNGHTTSLDSFWMGVPVVTLVGPTVFGRAGLSQLSNLGLPELIALTPEQYVEIAAGLASDLPRLAELRRTLRPRMLASPLMDGPRFARNIGAAYRQMWRTWCAGGERSPVQSPAK